MFPTSITYCPFGHTFYDAPGYLLGYSTLYFSSNLVYSFYCYSIDMASRIFFLLLFLYMSVAFFFQDFGKVLSILVNTNHTTVVFLQILTEFYIFLFLKLCFLTHIWHKFAARRKRINKLSRSQL